MATSISLAWSACHVRYVGKGRYQLTGIPAHLQQQACTRLLQLGVTRAKVTGPSVVAFQCPANHPALAAVVTAFPCSPLPSAA
jgi:hypothetical protein